MNTPWHLSNPEVTLERTILFFKTAQDFESWLETHHSQDAGIWIQIEKKGSKRSSITYPEAVECALCFGWIDGQKAKHDENSWLQYFTRRKKNSIWSQINRNKAERLILDGRMRAPGGAAIGAAKKSGAWDAAYQPVSSREIPVELEKALAKSKKARDFFETLDSHNRFTFVFRVSTAKKEATRLKRIVEYIRMMENGDVLNPNKVK